MANVVTIGDHRRAQLTLVDRVVDGVYDALAGAFTPSTPDGQLVDFDLSTPLVDFDGVTPLIDFI